MIKCLILLLGVAGIVQAGDSLEEVKVVKSEFIVVPNGVIVAGSVQQSSYFTQDEIENPQAAQTALKEALKGLSKKDKHQLMWSWQEIDPLIVVAAMRGKDFDGNINKLINRLKTFKGLPPGKKAQQKYKALEIIKLKVDEEEQEVDRQSCGQMAGSFACGMISMGALGVAGYVTANLPTVLEFFNQTFG